MTIKRGTGRQALIEATADVLRSGGEVQVKDVAEIAGVSHTLIYRHFPDGGKEEMVAEAYAYIFRSMAESDIDALFTLVDNWGQDVEIIRDFILGLLNPRRAEIRWLRLEALSQIRTNPYAAERIEAARNGLIRAFADHVMKLEPTLTRESALAFSIIAQALPLGVTAITGTSMTKHVRERVADMWAQALVQMLAEATA